MRALVNLWVLPVLHSRHCFSQHFWKRQPNYGIEYFYTLTFGKPSEMVNFRACIMRCLLICGATFRVRFSRFYFICIFQQRYTVVDKKIFFGSKQTRRQSCVIVQSKFNPILNVNRIIEVKNRYQNMKSNCSFDTVFSCFNSSVEVFWQFYIDFIHDLHKLPNIRNNCVYIVCRFNSVQWKTVSKVAWLMRFI